ncbi:MAG: DUF1189 domain-containing protein [Candidatus Methanosuratincola sp.]
MVRYSIYQAPFFSFFSASFYRYVGLSMAGLPLFYLFLLVASCSVLTMAKLHQAVSDFVENKLPLYAEQLPTVIITRGQVSTDVPTPYVIEDPDTGAPFIIIDTTGAVTTLQGTEAFVLVMRDKILYRKQNTLRTLDLSDVDSLTIDYDRVIEWGSTAKRWLAVVLYPFAALFYFVWRAIQTMVFAGIGMLFAKHFRARLGYKALVRLSVVAITPPIVLDTLLFYFDATIPLWAIFFFAVSMGYVYYGVRSCAPSHVA